MMFLEMIIVVVGVRKMHILLADDQPSIRSAIRLLLEQHFEKNLLGEAATAGELLDYIRDYHPDMLLLDWDLIDSAPEKILAALRTLCPDLFIIVLDSKPQIKPVTLKAGANEFVSKNDPPECLLASISSYRYSLKKEASSY
jgi:DNA-binding NarL/FixJ family response regulator